MILIIIFVSLWKSFQCSNSGNLNIGNNDWILHTIFRITFTCSVQKHLQVIYKYIWSRIERKGKEIENASGERKEEQFLRKRKSRREDEYGIQLVIQNRYDVETQSKLQFTIVSFVFELVVVILVLVLVWIEALVFPLLLITIYINVESWDFADLNYFHSPSLI